MRLTSNVLYDHGYQGGFGLPFCLPLNCPRLPKLPELVVACVIIYAMFSLVTACFSALFYCILRL